MAGGVLRGGPAPMEFDAWNQPMCAGRMVICGLGLCVLWEVYTV